MWQKSLQCHDRVSFAGILVCMEPLHGVVTCVPTDQYLFPHTKHGLTQPRRLAASCISWGASMVLWEIDIFVNLKWKINWSGIWNRGTCLDECEPICAPFHLCSIYRPKIATPVPQDRVLPLLPFRAFLDGKMRNLMLIWWSVQNYLIMHPCAKPFLSPSQLWNVEVIRSLESVYLEQKLVISLEQDVLLLLHFFCWLQVAWIQLSSAVKWRAPLRSLAHLDLTAEDWCLHMSAVAFCIAMPRTFTKQGPPRLTWSWKLCLFISFKITEPWSDDVPFGCPRGGITRSESKWTTKRSVWEAVHVCPVYVHNWKCRKGASANRGRYKSSWCTNPSRLIDGITYAIKFFISDELRSPWLIMKTHSYPCSLCFGYEWLGVFVQQASTCELKQVNFFFTAGKLSQNDAGVTAQLGPNEPELHDSVIFFTNTMSFITCNNMHPLHGNQGKQLRFSLCRAVSVEQKRKAQDHWILAKIFFAFLRSTGQVNVTHQWMIFCGAMSGKKEHTPQQRKLHSQIKVPLNPRWCNKTATFPRLPSCVRTRKFMVAISSRKGGTWTSWTQCAKSNMKSTLVVIPETGVKSYLTKWHDLELLTNWVAAEQRGRHSAILMRKRHPSDSAMGERTWSMSNVKTSKVLLWFMPNCEISLFHSFYYCRM